MDSITLAIEHRKMIRFIILEGDYSDEAEKLEFIEEYNDLAEELDLETWEESNG